MISCSSLTPLAAQLEAGEDEARSAWRVPECVAIEQRDRSRGRATHLLGPMSSTLGFLRPLRSTSSEACWPLLPLAAPMWWSWPGTDILLVPYEGCACPAEAVETEREVEACGRR